MLAAEGVIKASSVPVVWCRQGERCQYEVREAEEQASEGLHVQVWVPGKVCLNILVLLFIYQGGLIGALAATHEISPGSSRGNFSGDF